ncbi:MAG: 30S ribosomal protein S24e [Candidatus Thermoplasmatota archaeon]|nr:30S ribosomal protein S24e [Candidatus Thermoplasmatota archaeon]
MEVEVLSKQKNKLLSRLEVKFTLRFDEGPTPRRDSVRLALEKLLKLKDKAVVIDYIIPEFGKREAGGYAKVYDSLEEASRVERKYVLKRNGLLEAE